MDPVDLYLSQSRIISVATLETDHVPAASEKNGSALWADVVPLLLSCFLFV